MALTLAELAEIAEIADEPAITTPPSLTLGGVDPLGLRQINFDLMDHVFPGINNVVRYIRPFTVVTWAWRRAARTADKLGQTRIAVPTLMDFVARIEVTYVWSQLIRNPRCELPGRDVLAPLVNGPGYYFGGDDWERRKKVRTNSTALSAPINYGPAIRAFGWLHPDSLRSGALVAMPIVEDALEVIDEAMGDALGHPLFSSFDPVEVTSGEVGAWADVWALDQPSEAERLAMAATLAGETAPKCRRDGVALVAAACEHLGGIPSSHQVLRRVMCGPPGDFTPPPALHQVAQAWRTTQNRQAFRLALEALFYWICGRLDDGPAMTGVLVRDFLNATGGAATAGQWLDDVLTSEMGPADWIERLDLGLRAEDDESELPIAIRGAIAACLAEAPASSGTESDDRLPLARAAKEAAGWRDGPSADFLAHVFDSWVFGQHVYWSVWRGLADARAGGKTILRLKVALEDDGWTMMSGASASWPQATPDRLSRIIDLMTEADLLR